ncbi:MAG: four helix bundle protein [Armatimonadota bacterium]
MPNESAAPRERAKAFQDLLVWQRTHQFVLHVYAHTASFPKHELYGLTSQCRRAAVSIAANIAEGFKKRGKPDKARFMNQAQGSLEECKYYLILARDLGYKGGEACPALADEVGRLLQAYHDAIVRDNR